MRISHGVILSWLFLAGAAAAQSLSIGSEKPIGVGGAALATNVSLASNGREFAALWRSDNGDVFRVSLDADAQVRTETLAIEPYQPTAVIATDGAGYLAALTWGDRIDLHALPNGAYEWAFPRAVVEPSTLRAAGGEGGYLVVWRAQEKGVTWLQATIAGREGKRREDSFVLNRNASPGVASITSAGSRFIAAYRTSRGIEVAVVDANRVAVIAQQLVAEVAADPIVVSTSEGAALFFSLPLNGWNDDAVTYRLALGDDGKARGEPELVANGTLLAAIADRGQEVIAIRDAEVTLLRLCGTGCNAEELARLPLRFHGVESIAANGAGFLLAAVGNGTELMFVSGEGREPPRITSLSFAAIDVRPYAHAIAGDVDLVMWSEERQSAIPQTYCARFRDGVLLDTPRFLLSPHSSAIASDGASTFLVTDYDQIERGARAELQSLDQPGYARVWLGRGDPRRAIWDGQDFLVFFVEESSVIRAARVSRNGVCLTPAGGVILTTGSGIGDVFATPTSSGFVIAYTTNGKTRIAAFSPFFTPITAIVRGENGFPISLAGNGSDRVAAGVVEGGSGFKTLLLNDRLQTIAVTSGASTSMIWSNGLVLSFFQAGGAPVFGTLWQPDEARLALGDPPRFELEAPPLSPLRVLPILAGDGHGRVVGLYARRAVLAGGSQHLRMFTRTFTVLGR